MSLRTTFLRALGLDPDEARGLVRPCAASFALLFGSAVLRPLRDEMGVAGGADKLPWLFSATALASLALAPVLAMAAARLPPSRLVPAAYRVIAVMALGFLIALRTGVPAAPLARGFFVWASVVNLLLTSLLWSALADRATSIEGRRTFGVVAAAGSAGALLGPLAVTLLARPLGSAGLVLLSALALEAAARAVRGLPAPARLDAPPGRGVAADLALLFRSAQLRELALQTLLFSAGSTFLYLEQMRRIGAALTDPARRTALFAVLDLAVNLGAALAQALGTARLLRRIGLAGALAVVPLVTLAGGGLLLASTPLLVLLGLVAVRRALHYALERPAREVLFTAVPRNAKFATKGLVDTAVYRASDALSGWAFALLPAIALPVGLATLPAAAAALVLAARLGRRHTLLEQEEACPSPAATS